MRWDYWHSKLPAGVQPKSLDFSLSDLILEDSTSRGGPVQHNWLKVHMSVPDSNITFAHTFVLMFSFCPNIPAKHLALL